ncbi:hypothetical protein BCY91_02065 [Pelobium manganitolerans]|uniref:Glycosyltransferase subfamily 4-like N-terminal domain-containing protein n=2 Tax=Pelobium manganitolerans TaxID=1842495 RepID=A0A419SC81_9SPHI|nr:hypothetical protein BCY91_02065 [Pelobium manganitolerans]
MRIFKKIAILTYDLHIQQTSTHRYLSFLETLIEAGYEVELIGVDFPFLPNPINNVKKEEIIEHLRPYVKTLKPSYLNFIQKLLIYADAHHFPYQIKKILLAAHIIFYRVDQWTISRREFENRSFKPDLIISGGSGGIIKSAFSWAKKTNAKLFLDYRDPWTYGYNLLETSQKISYFKKIFTRNQEKRYLKFAEKVITVSETLKSFFPSPYKEKINIIENGSNFSEVKETKKERSVFSIVYIGTLYNDQLIDESFFFALKQFVNKNNLSAQKIKLCFVGSTQNQKLGSVIEKHGLTDFTEIAARKGTSELLYYLLEASLFLHLRYGKRSGIITSKQADYLYFNKPILLPNSDHGDIADSINSYKAGYVCNGRIEVIEEVLDREYHRFLDDQKLLKASTPREELSRKVISKKLLDMIS